jgi:hypothetical protein
MKNLPGWTYCERWTLLLVEGAQALKILAGLGQGHVMAHDVGNINPIPDPINDFVRNQAVAHESRTSYLLVAHDRTSQLLSDGIN